MQQIPLKEIAPLGRVVSRTGKRPSTPNGSKMSWVHWRWACPKFLRQTFHEWARITIRYSVWARACYEQQLGRGKSRQVAIRALAFKWMRIVFRCWKDRKPYSDVVYTAALSRRRQPAANGLSTVNFQRKNCAAGLAKLSALPLDTQTQMSVNNRILIWIVALSWVLLMNARQKDRKARDGKFDRPNSCPTPLSHYCPKKRDLLMPLIGSNRLDLQ